MADRELLELAAKAAGIKALRDPHGVLRDCTGSDPARNIFACKEWNPLTDDGDALRLAVKLGMAVLHDDSAAVRAGWALNQHVPITRDGSGPWYWKEWLRDHNGAPYAATRRAIVCAAAEIGKAMP